MEKYPIEPYTETDETSDFRKEAAYLRAKKKVKAILGFYWHLASYLIVNIFLIILIALNTNESFFSFAPYATAVFWGIGLLFHFVGVFGPDFFFGSNWEQRKIEEYMDKEERHWE